MFYAAPHVSMNVVFFEISQECGAPDEWKRPAKHPDECIYPRSAGPLVQDLLRQLQKLRLKREARSVLEREHDTKNNEV